MIRTRVTPLTALAACAATTLGAAVLAPLPAFAAAPGNDTYAGRQVIDTVPFSASLDTSEATTDVDDTAINADCGAPATDASVWYEFTPAEDGTFLLGLSADFTAGAIVAAGGPGNWVVEACGPEAVGFAATAGTTYTLLVFDDQQDGGGNGGTVDVSLEPAPPTPEVDVTVDPKATFNKDGSILLTGTVACSAGAETELDLSVTQTVGRLKINGFGFTLIDCGDGSRQPWQAVVTGDNGIFKGGKAASVTTAFACGVFDCGVDFDETVVKVSGGKG